MSILIFNHQPSTSSLADYFPSNYFQSIVAFHRLNFPHRFIRFRCSAVVNHVNSQTVHQSAVKRIGEKLRRLGYVSDDEDDAKETEISDTKGEIFIPLPKHLPEYRVGHSFDTSWSTPENPVPEPGFGNVIQRFHKLRNEVRRVKIREKEKGIVERKERLPTLAELTLPKEELQRLRANAIGIKRKLTVGRVGITEGIVKGIHERWRKSELVKIICDDIYRLNMKMAHDLLERKTGGQVLWRSGTKIILYRGANYKYPYDTIDESVDETNSREDSDIEMNKEEDSGPTIVKGLGLQSKVHVQLPGELQMIEEADHLLDGLGPRYRDWWGRQPMPVDADLLSEIVPGFKKPFRLIPYGVKAALTNDEMTILKRLGRPLPCHFVLGRNRKHQGLAVSILKLWEKCEIVKVAVKRGAQNTNSKLMAEELKRLTGGILLSRNKEFFVLYRGKDFLPATVSSAFEDQRKNGKRVKKDAVSNGSQDDCDVKSNQKSGPLSEKMKLKSIEAAIRRNSSKLEMTLQKKMKAEKLLAELEKEEIQQIADVDKEGITKEERFMLRKAGLQMGPFLLLGRRGVFDGTIENIHLHWKYRELVKIIYGVRHIEEIHGVARMLEAESGGILIAVERVNKGFAIILYRGKNYETPSCLRPETLLNKKEALKRSLEAQRRESLRLHILKLIESADDLKLQLDNDKETIKSQYPHEIDGSKASADDLKLQLDNDKETIKSQYPHEIDGSKASADLEHVLNEPTAMAGSSSVSGREDDTGSVSCHDDHKLDGAVSLVPKHDNFHVLHNIVSHTLADKPSGSTQLSKREKLYLRKQALSMKKLQHPVLGVGTSNSISGIAKTINAHFEKHNLAIVNVKGRAKGTSVQELVIKLEEATGSVLVSQEPSKVILYLGRKGNGKSSRKLAEG